MIQRTEQTRGVTCRARVLALESQLKLSLAVTKGVLESNSDLVGRKLACVATRAVTGIATKLGFVKVMADPVTYVRVHCDEHGQHSLCVGSFFLIYFFIANILFVPSEARP